MSLSHSNSCLRNFTEGHLLAAVFFSRDALNVANSLTWHSNQHHLDITTK